MGDKFAKRIIDVPKSFIREILKVASDPKIISFAGGLPNPEFFPIKEIQNACNKVLEEDGKNILQYSTTEGYLPLRKYIADKYNEKEGLNINPDNILITSGSQQGLDLIGKVFINEGENILIEEPGYLGAIQSFSVYMPNFMSVKMEDDGVDINHMKEIFTNNKIKLFYSVVNFQNPSGITYSLDKRKELANILKSADTLFIEDDPYGELRFLNEDIPSVKTLYDDTILLGSFSKIVTPSFRLGWIVAKPEYMERLVVAKQAADLHTNYFAQRVIYQFLIDNDISKHIKTIVSVYGKQRDAMINGIEKYFPKSVSYTKPEGGMFLWATLPNNISSLKLFDEAIKNNVAFVPGVPFYSDVRESSSFRLNYSCLSVDKITEGIEILGQIIYRLVKQNEKDN